MRKSICVLLASLPFVFASAAFADSITFHPGVRTASEAEAAVGAPTFGKVWSFFVTTDGDILSVGKIAITNSVGAPLNPYQNVLGANNGPAAPAILIAFPGAAADSYINTPGNTSILGVDMPGDGSDNSAWGDLSNDGPQTNFKFAQLTFPTGVAWKFTGQVSIGSPTNPGNVFTAPVSFEALEPGSFLMAAVGLVAVRSFRRRFSAA
jgi:hypothetical protein